ncbi:restriction endonuclease [Ignisphaera aggregans DSM 17230]|uniref:Restriction endonuclease n=1 Tax=Ignisphaera aggregans (strain DSM 17230 / JCM 13409 / AQ1.S1) TaxID=583356 RepID=E0STB6_IGNAA|nr:restriction endonuclease [Ignisphaera aggregans DSM 17230]
MKARKRGVESYSKGHLFEEVVEKYFQYLGYRVERNVVKTGYSGAKHEIDVLIVKGDTIGVVEAKNYSKPIPKEWIIKAHHIAEDIGASEVYVVSAKGFTEDAVKTASILGVKLLDLNEMAEVVKRIREVANVEAQHLRPAYGLQEAIVFADKFALRKLFIKTESPTEVELIYVPLYYVEAIYTYIEVEGLIFKKEVKRHRKVGFCVSALNGGLVLYEKGSISTIAIPSLTDSETNLINMLWSYEAVTLNELIEKTGWSRNKLVRTLNALVEKGLVKESERSEGKKTVKIYRLALPSVEVLEESSRVLLGSNKLESGTPDKALEAKIGVNHVKMLIEKLYGIEVADVKIIYMPIYKVKMEKTDRSAYRFIYLTGWITEPIDAIALIERNS